MLSFNKQKAYDQDQTISLATSKVFAQLMFSKMLILMGATHVVPCALPIHVNQHSQHPQNFKSQKHKIKMVDDAEDSTVQGLKDK